MKLHIRDFLWVILLVSLCLAWRRDAISRKLSSDKLRDSLAQAEIRLQLAKKYLYSANIEADVFAEETRRLRGLIKSSLGDQRDWFELEVSGREIVAIRPAVSQKNLMTLDTIERIETETGLKARRLRHFLTPITDLRVRRDE